MKRVDKYIAQQIGLTTLVVSFILVIIIFLIQSLRFLDVIIEAGASGSMFWMLTLLALPRFFEVIVPISLLIATLFIYNRLISESELLVMRSAGLSPLCLSCPALFLAALISTGLFINSGWIVPKSLSSMEQTLHIIKSQASSFLFREGVFTNFGDKITAYIQKKHNNGSLEGTLLQDRSRKQEPPITILAKRGALVVDDQNNKRVVVYEGSRQQYIPQKQTLERLEFDQYTINFPKEDIDLDVQKSEPEALSLIELFLSPSLTATGGKDKHNKDLNTHHTTQNNTKPENSKNKSTRHHGVDLRLAAELHKRLSAPFLPLTFTALCLAILMSGSFNRHGINGKILLAAIGGIIIQGLFLGAFNYAQKHQVGLIMMYILTFAPLILSLIYLNAIPYISTLRSNTRPSEKGS